MLNNQKGITLIALIITIIVMLILVGVTINVALNGGIFAKAETATKQTQEAIDYEELQMAVIAGLDNSLKIPNVAAINNNLTNWDITGADGGPYVCTSPKGNIFTVDEKGNITSGDNGADGIDFETIKQDLITNPQTYLAKAKEAGQDTEVLTDIGIGTDGNVVNLGSWTYSILDGSSAELVGASGVASYTGSIEGGKIVGTVPQYIYSEGNIYTVTSLTCTFSGLVGLKYAPKLPTTVTETSELFMFCEDLEEVPVLHEGLLSATMMFEGCTSLSQVDLNLIPETVTRCTFMFGGCSNLVNAPIIPASVTYIEGMFADCTNLTGTINVKSDSCGGTQVLSGVGSAENPIVLKGTGNNLEILEAIKATGNSDYITIEQ